MFNFFKNIKSYFFYKKVINQKSQELKDKFNIRIDAIGRLYTIFSIDPLDYKQYGEELFDKELKKYISSLDKYLKNQGLIELYGLSNQEKIDDLNCKIIIRFKPFNPLLLANILLFGILTMISSIIIGAAIIYVF